MNALTLVRTTTPPVLDEEDRFSEIRALMRKHGFYVASDWLRPRDFTDEHLVEWRRFDARRT